MILCESDVLRMHGGFIISKWLRRGFLTSKVQCDLLLNHKTYDCTARLRKFGGYEIIRFKDNDSEKEVLDYFFGFLKDDVHFLRYYVLRLLAKTVILFFQFLIPIYLVLHLKEGYTPLLITACTCIGLAGELFFFIMQGVLNRL